MRGPGTGGGELGGARRLAQAVAVVRIGVGLTALVAPSAVARPWIGEEAKGQGAKVLGRALGGRDLALGLGALFAGDRLALRRWVAAAVLADLVDTGVTALAFGRLDRRGRWVVLASAAGAAAAGAGALGSL